MQDQLPNSVAMYYDDYSLQGPEDFITWIQSGADPNEWNIEPIMAGIKEHIEQGYSYIVLDFPFGRNHQHSQDWLDLTVFLDTPLDVAMARRVIREGQSIIKRDLPKEMKQYIECGRVGYLASLEQVKPASDIVIDGLLPVETIVSKIKKHLIKKD